MIIGLLKINVKEYRIKLIRQGGKSLKGDATKKSTIDSIITIIFFILMLPASLLLERLVFHREGEGKSRIISLILIFMLSTYYIRDSA